MGDFLKKIKINLYCLKCAFLASVFPEKYILVRASVKFVGKKLVHYNWGDDMNVYLLPFFTKKKPLVISNCILARTLPIDLFMCVGSIVTFYPLTNTFVWGSGIINNNKIDLIKGKPKKICAVRGPKTREELIKLGIECPEVYGDPIMLLPLYYRPKVEKKYKLGIIPHFIDADNVNVKRLLKDTRTVMIKVQNYEKWQDFIDEICSCDFVISSSLHGLIASEAYGIPNMWVKFGEYVDGWDFKFYDFYESMGKTAFQFEIKNDTVIEEIYNLKNQWEQGHIDVEKLLDACPIK